jgi:hypothetical protein
MQLTTTTPVLRPATARDLEGPLLEPFYGAGRSAFPNMRPNNAHVVRRHDSSYNCIAWAMGDEHRWWWPNTDWKRSFWPRVLRDTLGCDRESFDALFRHAGAEPTETEEYEPGFVKLALFSKDGAPKHIARRQDGQSRRWLSKCGNGLAIVHDLWEMNGGLYGDVERLMKVPECEWRKLRDLN